MNDDRLFAGNQPHSAADVNRDGNVGMKCPKCRTPLSVPASRIGKKAQCSKCQLIFAITLDDYTAAKLSSSKAAPREPQTRSERTLPLETQRPDKEGQLVEANVVCPHCWHEFFPDQAYWISQHNGLRGGDVVLVDPGAAMRFAPHEVQRHRDGSVVDPKGMKMIERACPVCHLQIPRDVLAHRPFFLSVVGAPRSGKTYFLTAMMHWLGNDLARYFGFTLRPSDSHEVKAFVDYDECLFGTQDPNQLINLPKTEEAGNLYNRVRLSNVAVQLPKPFIFSLEPTSANLDAPRLGNRLRRSVVLYDNAGESFEPLKEQSAGGENRVTQHLSQSDAVIFAFDPLQVPEARQRLRQVSQDPQLTRAAVTHNQESILNEVIHRIDRHRSRRLPPPVLVVCVQKYDVWNSLVAHQRPRSATISQGSYIDHTSVEYRDTEGIAGLDIEEINLISHLTRGFVNDVSPKFVATAESRFEIVRYFPVSSLGSSPEYDDSATGKTATEFLKVRPINLQPFRVTHPLLWLLCRWNMLRRYQRASWEARDYPHAKIDGFVNGRLRVLSPFTQGVISLDREYAGSTIVDPFCGDLIWIPEITKPKAEPVRPASQPELPPESNLKLSLDDATKPRKRGWFRK